MARAVPSGRFSPPERVIVLGLFFARRGAPPAGTKILTTDLDRYAANRDDLWQI
jgi:hypothetical protein